MPIPRFRLRMEAAEISPSPCRADRQSRSCRTWARSAASRRTAWYTPVLMGWSGGRASTQAGRNRSSSRRGNSYSSPCSSSVISCSPSSRQFTGRQRTSYRRSMSAAMDWAEFNSTTKGLPSSCSSRITRSSASR